MIWLIIILAIVIISFVLALRSMRTYKEIPTARFQYGLFLIKNESLIIENGVINKLYEYCAESNAIISLERLFNGSERALVLYAPQNIGQFVPELELLEIEDYLLNAPHKPNHRIKSEHSVTWSIKSKDEEKLEIKPEFMKELGLEPQQNFFWQMVMVAAKKNFHFQVNLRAMIVESDIHKRIDLAKSVTNYLSDLSGFEKNQTKDSNALLFEEFQKRIISPSEAEGFVLSSQTIKKLI